MFTAEKYIFAKIFKRFTNSIKTNSTVLDFACNNFFFANHLEHTIYTGADINEDAIKRGLKKYPHFKGIKADMNTPLKYFKPNSYNTVISTHTLNYLPPKEIPRIISELSDITNEILFFNLLNRSDNFEKKLDNVLKNKFKKVKKIKYCGTISEKWTQFLTGYTEHKEGIKCYFKKGILKEPNKLNIIFFALISLVALIIVPFDGIGRQNRLIYICKYKKNNLFK